MAVHNWKRVEADIFHAFHLMWIAELDKVFNGGLLPSEYYAIPEQHAASSISPTTLHATPDPLPPTTEARRRTLAIRHVSHHRLVTLIEIVSPANKDRVQSVADFAGKVVSAFDYGVHVFLVDPLLPGPHDPAGMHGAIWQRLESTEEPYDLPANDRLTLASYVAAEQVDIYLEHPALGAPLPDMPLFLRPDRYVSVPLEATYVEAYRSMPAFWREVLEGEVS